MLRGFTVGLQERPSHLVVLLHGWGAEGKDVASLAEIFSRIMPFAAFHLPTAPFPSSDGQGFDWLGEAGVRSSSPHLDAYVDEVMAKYGLDESKTILAGMAEGMMAALHVGLRRARPFAGIVGFCGMLAEPETLSYEIRSRPPMFLAHGEKDSTIPLELFMRTARVLRENEVRAELHVAPGIGHTVDHDMVTRAWRFMYRAMNAGELPQ